MSARINTRNLMFRWNRASAFLKNDFQFQRRKQSVLALPFLKTSCNVNGVKRSIHEMSIVSTKNSRSSNERSYHSSTANLNLRAFPSYNIFGETCVLNVKPIMPKFKAVGQDGNILDVGERGRLMFSFIPRHPSGIQWKNQISFALSPEEVGLLTTQLPFNPCMFTRELKSYSSGMNSERYASISDDDCVSKTMTIAPIEGASISFEIDYKKNGVGGQIPPVHANEDNHDFAPLNIVVQAGEWEVLRLAAQQSIPVLIGWTKLMEVASNDAVTKRSD